MHGTTADTAAAVMDVQASREIATISSNSDLDAAILLPGAHNINYNYGVCAFIHTRSE